MQIPSGFFFKLQNLRNAGTFKESQKQSAKEKTSAPVLAAFSIGIGPVELALTFPYSSWFRISDSTALVQRLLVGLSTDSPNL
ncbi:hypothetical protein ACFX10_004215 [Malus domestica]